MQLILQNGDTALHIAAAMGRRKLTRILLEAGCDKSLKNKVIIPDTCEHEASHLIVCVPTS
jgi:ankyrin repeat protein